jgi:hypothetical protein
VQGDWQCTLTTNLQSTKRECVEAPNQDMTCGVGMLLEGSQSLSQNTTQEQRMLEVHRCTYANVHTTEFE